VLAPYVLKRVLRFVFVTAAAFIILSRIATASGANTAPGTYKDWDGDIDHVTVVQVFKQSDYNRIVVTSVETDGVDLPDESESTYRPVKDALAKTPKIFIEGLKEKLSGRFVVTIGEVAPRTAGTLLIHAKVMKMNPGSRTGRALGRAKLLHAMTDAAETRIAGEIADAMTGQVLVRFTQQRRAGLGLFGGEYEHLLARAIHDIGNDVGRIVKAF